MNEKSDALEGCLLGCAVGDSLGLPTEGLSRRRTSKMMKLPLRQGLIGSVGMCSDDTEHMFFTAQALLRSQGDPDQFVQYLARSLRVWFLAIPAGVGLATAKACLKLCFGVSPSKSGVPAAGNGPAMRAPILGVFASGQPELQRRLVEVSTRLTHTDPDAVTGARLIAAMADFLSAGLDPEDSLTRVMQLPDLSLPWMDWLSQIRSGLNGQKSVRDMADQLGLEKGVSGYICHTVPMVIFTVLRHQDNPMAGLEALIACGGDTDTTAAIAGALYGARLGPSAFPDRVVRTLHNGPMSVPVLRRAAQALARKDEMPVRWPWPLIPIRNLFFLAVVLCHGFRRILPPY